MDTTKNPLQLNNNFKTYFLLLLLFSGSLNFYIAHTGMMNIIKTHTATEILFHLLLRGERQWQKGFMREQMGIRPPLNTASKVNWTNGLIKRAHGGFLETTKSILLWVNDLLWKWVNNVNSPLSGRVTKLNVFFFFRKTFMGKGLLFLYIKYVTFYIVLVNNVMAHY